MRVFIVSLAAGNNEGDSVEAPAPTKNVSFSSSDINSLIFNLDFLIELKLFSPKLKKVCSKIIISLSF